ncbi:uridine kinase [Sporosarcina sp. FSL W7-1283]|uniref:uridine kinase n=1 Tax=Sporosarcina sp. FSL W7-1283 TaxID=2921560 RepID=UPI0030F557A3
MSANLPNLHTGRTVVIGIDGLGGSGKSTYARDLQQAIKGVHLFHLDDFIHPKKIRYNEEYEEWYGYYYLQWRYEYLINELLAPLKNEGEVRRTIELYDKETDGYIEQEIDIPSGSIVLIEGVFLQRPEIRPYVDHVIFLNVDKQTRLKRVIDRDVYIGTKEEIISKYERRYFPAEEMYMKLCKPLASAHYIDR